MNRVSKYWGHKAPEFKAYDLDPQALKRFTGNHPAVLENWFKEKAETSFEPNPNYVLTRKDRRYRLMMKLETKFDLEMSKKHYRLVKEE
jgi:hypothetical protein